MKACPVCGCTYFHYFTRTVAPAIEFGSQPKVPNEASVTTIHNIKCEQCDLILYYGDCVTAPLRGWCKHEHSKWVDGRLVYEPGETLFTTAKEIKDLKTLESALEAFGAELEKE
jgi:hypothetical protein